MKKFLFLLFIPVLFFSCKDQGKTFTVSGKIENSPGKFLYLEEVPIGTMRAQTIDTVELGTDGSFKLTAPQAEAAIYNIRIDQDEYPVAAVINDVAAIELNVTMRKDNNHFPEKYEVKGSPASLAMKDYLKLFNDKLKTIFETSQQLDSLRNITAPDSLVNAAAQNIAKTGASLKEYVLAEIKKSNNAALTMFELGYYQSSANNPMLGLQPLNDEEVMAIVETATAQNPEHVSLAGLKQTLLAQMNSQNPSAGGGQWVGRAAPDFSLPDINGKPVSLSSFKGKYVLIDFWASWCMPCRVENPNIVAAYKNFKDKNFTILGVSLDEDKGKWLEAIKKDGLPWTQVSDLKQWESMVVSLYQFNGIPYNVLVDPEGKVIAEGLRGSDLGAKLAEILK